MIPLRLSCLGMPRLLGQDGNPVHFRTRKHLALLIYLAIEPPLPHRRERLAGLLWPMSNGKQGRHSLATALSVLRSHIGRDAFDCDRETVRLVPGHIEADVTRLASTEGVGISPGDPVGLLEDFELPDAIDFSHWVDRIRARILPIIHARLVRRLDEYRRIGDSTLMMRTADQLQRLDPLSEEAVRALLESRAMAGDRIGSLRAFEAWRSRVAEELGASPSYDLERLVERLRRHQTGHWARTAACIEAPECGQNQPFVGRSLEFQVCYDSWKHVQESGLRQIIVVSEPGFGKTSFLSKITNALGLESARVTRVACEVSTKHIPFAMLRDLVTGLLEHSGSGTTDPVELSILGEVATEVRRRWPGMPEATSYLREAQHVRLTDALLSLLRAISEEHPIVIAIDDIDRADPVSRLIFEHTVSKARDQQILILLTSSETDSNSSSGVLPSRAAHLLRLPCLNEEDSHLLLTALVSDGLRLSATIRNKIVVGARGSPRTIREMLSDWRSCGYDAPAFAVSAMITTVDAHHAKQFIDNCGFALPPLDQDAHAVLALAAIMRNGIGALSMYSLVDLPISRTLHGLALLRSARILADHHGVLEFVNPIVHAACYLAQTPAARMAIHGMVAERLAGKNNESDGDENLELIIAWHLIRAAKPEDAASRLIRGGRMAIQRGEPHQAEAALSTGLPILTGGYRWRGELLLAEARQELGQWRESLAVLGVSDTDSEEGCWRAVHRLTCRRWLGELSGTEILTGIDQLLSIAGADHHISLRVNAASAAVRLLTLARAPDRITALAATLKHLEQDVIEPHDHLHLLLAKAWTQSASGANIDALDSLRLGVSLGREARMGSSILVRLLVGLGNTLAVIGQYDKAIGPLTEAEALARALDNETLIAECSIQLAVVYGRLGERSAQIDWARKASELFLANDWSPSTVGAMYELGLGLALEGRSLEARSVAVGLLTSLPSHRPSWIRQASLFCAADIMAISGHPARASRLARAALLVGDGRVLNESYAGLFARWVAQTSIEDSNPERGLSILASQIRPETLHSKDRAEWRAARACLLKYSGFVPASEMQAARDELAGLPLGVSLTLRGLGMHPDQGMHSESH
jgi:DNA-binding SARP family transcriptional activator/tetratricopeptide (TPR) repeat protein